MPISEIILDNSLSSSSGRGCTPTSFNWRRVFSVKLVASKIDAISRASSPYSDNFKTRIYRTFIYCLSQVPIYILSIGFTVLIILLHKCKNKQISAYCLSTYLLTYLVRTSTHYQQTGDCILKIMSEQVNKLCTYIIYYFFLFLLLHPTCKGKMICRGVSGGWAGPPSFGRIEGAAGRWRGGRGAPHYYLPTQFKVATYTPDLSQKLYLPTMQCAKKILFCFVDEILGYNLHWFFPLCYSWKLHKFWLTTFYEKTSNF